MRNNKSNSTKAKSLSNVHSIFAESINQLLFEIHLVLVCLCLCIWICFYLSHVQLSNWLLCLRYNPNKYNCEKLPYWFETNANGLKEWKREEKKWAIAAFHLKIVYIFVFVWWKLFSSFVFSTVFCIFMQCFNRVFSR